MQRPRDLAVAFSLANLCYLRVWSELLTYTRANTYLMKTPPVPAEYAAVMMNVLLAGALFWGLATGARRFLSKRAFGFVEMGFLVALAVPLNALRSVLANDFPYLRSPLFEVLGTRGVAALAGALGLGGLAVVVFFHHRAARVAAAGLAIASPFCAITFGQAIWKAVHYDDRAYADKPAAPVAGVKRFPRVVWFICDEWDYRLTFIDRDRTLALPEIDRLRREAVFAENAFPPGPETPVSIPGYYTGRLVSAVEYQGPRQLGVKFQGESGLLPWSEQPNYFGRARDLGFNTALVEWFHPTCRVLDGLIFCRWWEMAMQHNSMGKDFGQILRNQTRSLFERLTYFPSSAGRSRTTSRPRPMGPFCARARPWSTRPSTVSRWYTFRYRTHRMPTTGARDSSRWETPPFADISTASRCSIARSEKYAGRWRVPERGTRLRSCLRPTTPIAKPSLSTEKRTRAFRIYSRWRRKMAVASMRHLLMRC